MDPVAAAGTITMDPVAAAGTELTVSGWSKSQLPSTRHHRELIYRLKNFWTRRLWSVKSNAFS
jgi:hypothetical protein